MNFPSLRKVVASTLAASVVLTSASVSSTLFVVNEANAGAATFSSKKPPSTSSEVTSLSALSGTWKIDWESEDAFHESTLIINKNGSGRMTTTVTFSDESKMTVVQDISGRLTKSGKKIIVVYQGTNPRDEAGTPIPATDYEPDTLQFRLINNGEKLFILDKISHAHSTNTISSFLKINKQDASASARPYYPEETLLFRSHN